MLENYFSMHSYSFLFLQVKKEVVHFLVQDFNFFFKVHEVFRKDFMNHSQLIVYQDELVKNHLIKLDLIYSEVLDNLLKYHKLDLRL